MRRLEPTEHQIQAAFFDIVRRQEGRYPALKLCFACPNGDLRNIVVAKRLKREGTRPGVPDVLLAVPMGGKSGLAMEFKKKKGMKRTPAQQAFESYLMMYGWRCELVYDPEQAWRIVREYLGI